ncbi:MAG: hypothetical protein ACREMB_11475 [Candidatus Rokuibacteriota bacterium]
MPGLVPLLVAFAAAALVMLHATVGIFLMGAGALLGLLGFFGIPFLLGGPGMKLLVLAVWGLVLVQLERGFRRA